MSKIRNIGKKSLLKQMQQSSIHFFKIKDKKPTKNEKVSYNNNQKDNNKNANRFPKNRKKFKDIIELMNPDLDLKA